jgi:hypothetical protein
MSMTQYGVTAGATRRRVHARPLLFLVAVVALAAVLSACGSSSKAKSGSTPKASAVSWPAPADPMARAQAAGLVPETAERLQYHVHSHLDVFLDGATITVPAGLGINITDPRVHTFQVDGQAQYGGINPPCDQPCISPLHTHDVSGILHTESATKKDNTLGQLFTEWNVKLDANCVDKYCIPDKTIAIYVDGKKFDGNPTTIALTDHREIAVVIGTPPAVIPNTADWSKI